jgi:hypothetical protein
MDGTWQPVRAWHRAVNDGDLDAARAAVTDEVKVGGPNGAASGVEVFVDWVRRSGIRLEPVAWHPVDRERVIVEQDATWPGRPDARPAAGQDPAPTRVATLFEVSAGRVAAALRFPSLAEARRGAGTTRG